MIQQLRKKFIVAAMLSLFLVLAVILGGVNAVSYHKTVSDADRILSLLTENQGRFPMHMFPERKQKEMEPKRREDDRHFSPETPYESRFFTVLLDEQGEIQLTDTEHIAAVDMDAAEEYARKALASGKGRGFLGDYRFTVEENRIIFLDCGRSLSAFRTTLLASFGVAALGMMGTFVLLLFSSGRIVKPIAESYEKQRQFITDAGHEIKTPLTVISADADLLELDFGENIWLEDIRKQTQRMVGLTNDLISLSRMDEAHPKTQYVDFPLSDVVEETAQSFLALATAKGRSLSIHVDPMLSFCGSDAEIRRLVSILLDNALKYSPEGTEIELSLRVDAKSILLSVENETVQPIEKEKLSRLFDRFYRMDSSRNSSIGGYGLGLAIAKGIVTAHRGKIRAESVGQQRIVFIASFPS